jgi:hypothetical protein
MKYWLAAMAGIVFVAFSLSATSSASLNGANAPAADAVGPHGFDFQFGQWRVHHRVKRPGSDHWVEFEGTSSVEPLMDGSANVENNAFYKDTQPLITQMAQTAVCNRHHSVDQQLCRWLLLGLGRLPSNELAFHGWVHGSAWIAPVYPPDGHCRDFASQARKATP